MKLSSAAPGGQAADIVIFAASETFAQTARELILARRLANHISHRRENLKACSPVCEGGKPRLHQQRAEHKADRAARLRSGHQRAVPLRGNLQFLSGGRGAS